MSRKPASLTMIFVISALLMSGGIKASANSDTAEMTRETIEQLELEFNNAMMGKDKEALNRLISDDCTAIDIMVFTKPLYIEQIMTNRPPKAQTLDSMSVKLYGDTAVVTMVATAEMLSPAGAWSDTIRRVNVWILAEGEWKIVSTQSTILPSADGC
jgi:ketosteroid isomerase-like protein